MRVIVTAFITGSRLRGGGNCRNTRKGEHSIALVTVLLAVDRAEGGRGEGGGGV